MPIYVYEVITETGEPGLQFEVFQQMSDPPLTHHPDTGLPVRKVIARPNLAGAHATQPAAKQLSDQNLDKLGFTKYVKSDKGGYEKTVGKQGPDRIAGPG